MWTARTSPTTRLLFGSNAPASTSTTTARTSPSPPVAARTGLGRNTLYRDPTLRAVIEEHRHRTATGGTLAGLTGDIDFRQRQVTVNRQIQREGDTYVVRAPKYGSERVVYLPDEVLDVLAGRLREHLGPDRAPSRWLFTVAGEPMYDNAVTWRWRATRRAAGLERVRPHDLRHFYASGLIADGCDVVTVQRCPRPRDSHHDPQHVQPPVAHGRGPDACGRLPARPSRPRAVAGTWGLTPRGTPVSVFDLVRNCSQQSRLTCKLG